jgi:hypothetical protein
MIRDIQNLNSKPVSDSLSVQLNQETDIIFNFIDFSINKFHGYYFEFGDSDMEDRISDLLVTCFNDHISKFENGYLSIIFQNKPTEPTSTRQPDIGVYPKPTRNPFKPIIVIEAKRLYDSSHSKEYVSGNTGGIERFKRCKHAANDKVCEMVGYVQVHDSDYWFTRINNWIDKIAKRNVDESIDWTDEKEKLVPLNVLTNVKKYSSINSRKSKGDFIQIYHYFVEL